MASRRLVPPIVVPALFKNTNMKHFWKYLATAAIVVSVTPLMSCDDEDYSSSPNQIDYSKTFVYLYEPTNTFSRVEYKANGEFITGPDEPMLTVPVRVTKAQAAEIPVEVAVDPSLIDEYNEANGTEYKLLEGASIINPNLTIPAGEYVSTESISISLGDHSGFLSGEQNLILPIVIRNAGGMTVSKSSRVFLTFNSTYRANYITMNGYDKTFKAVLTENNWQDKVKQLVIDDLFSLSYAPYEAATLNLTIDQSKVAQYNADNGTSYKFKSDARLASNAITIGTDARTAGITINTGDLTGIGNEEAYIIPVTLSSVTGASIEKYEDETYTFYVIVRGTSRELDVQKDSHNGTQIDNPVTCTVNGEDWLNIINYNSYAYGDIARGVPMEMDFGKVVKLSSILVNHWSAYYGAKGANLKTSVDGTNWLDWGDVAYEAMGEYYINLLPATECRYVKLTFTDSRQSTCEIDGMKFFGE